MQSNQEEKLNYRIREMQLHDIPAVARIESLTFASAWSYWIFFQELITPERYYIVAEIEDKIIGYAGLSWVLDEGHITTLAVKEDFRRKKIGSKLLETLIKKAKEIGLSFVTLEVRESNTPAQELYKKFGFCVEGVRRKYYTKPQEDALIMTLYLK